MSMWSQLSFQDASSPLMAQLIFFHDHAMAVITLIMTFVGYALMFLMTERLTSRYTFDAQVIETVWTILPAFILVFLALPSLRLLYLMDEVSDPSVTLKAVGHQWYWSYEYWDFAKLSFDSYMTPTDELASGDYRLLEVDNRAILPMNSEVRVLVTSADVIHAWAVPSIGVKVDAIPGRLNQLGFTINRPGVFYGQCSEICGANHSFMPIVLESVDSAGFIKWIFSYSE